MCSSSSSRRLPKTNSKVKLKKSPGRARKRTIWMYSNAALPHFSACKSLILGGLELPNDTSLLFFCCVTPAYERKRVHGRRRHIKSHCPLETVRSGGRISRNSSCALRKKRRIECLFADPIWNWSCSRGAKMGLSCFCTRCRRLMRRKRNWCRMMLMVVISLASREGFFVDWARFAFDGNR